MKCFNVVQRVLDETYSEIPGSGTEKDKAIAAALAGMSDKYLYHLLTTGGPDFSDPVARFAYVFKYVPSHAHWLHELIGWSPEAEAAFSGKKIRVTCLGGGPGSDVVGILKFLADLDHRASILCEIIDGCQQWQRTWSDLAFTLDLEADLHTSYVIHDLGNKETWSAPCQTDKADVVTVSFFASEVYHLSPLSDEYFSRAFKKLKPGALVLVNDNQSPTFFAWLDGLATSSSLEILLADSGLRKIYDIGERASVLGDYARRFSTNSKLQGKLFWRVYRKKA